MVQTMSKGLYSMSTVVQGEKLGQFLDTEMPSMDNLKVRHRPTLAPQSTGFVTQFQDLFNLLSSIGGAVPRHRDALNAQRQTK